MGAMVASIPAVSHYCKGWDKWGAKATCCTARDKSSGEMENVERDERCSEAEGKMGGRDSILLYFMPFSVFYVCWGCVCVCGRIWVFVRARARVCVCVSVLFACICVCVCWCNIQPIVNTSMTGPYLGVGLRVVGLLSLSLSQCSLALRHLRQ